MEALFHQIFAGISNGVIYASIGLALVMIHQATHHINFAQGEMAMFSTYVALTLIQAGVPYWGAFVLTLVFSFIAGMVLQRTLLMLTPPARWATPPSPTGRRCSLPRSLPGRRRLPSWQSGRPARRLATTPSSIPPRTRR